MAVKTLENFFDVELLRELLKAQGIPSEVSFLDQTGPMIAGDIDGAKIYVPAEQEDKAKRLIEEFFLAGAESEEDFDLGEDAG